MSVVTMQVLLRKFQNFDKSKIRSLRASISFVLMYSLLSRSFMRALKNSEQSAKRKNGIFCFENFVETLAQTFFDFSLASTEHLNLLIIQH